MLTNKRYAPIGTLLFNKEYNDFAVIIDDVYGYGGAPFKTVACVTRHNSHNTFGFLEVNENPELYGWEIADHATIVLYATQDNVKRIEKLKALVRLGYRGVHRTKKDLLDELEWRMSQ